MPGISKKNNVIVTGNGKKTILFAHGFGCDQHAWKYIKDDLARDHKLVLFDYVGAGNSDLDAYDLKKYSSLEGYANDILEICEELKLKDVVFIGHSVSCMIGALASIRQPALFKKLVFIGPSPRYINDAGYTGGFDQETIDSLFEVMDQDYIVWARSLAPEIMSKENDPKLGQELSDSFCSIDPAIAKDFARVTFLSDNRKDLALIPVESLTIQCSDDMIAPVAVGEYIKKHAPGNTLVILKAYGHCPHMSHPAETIAAIRAYI
jgi:sigma-B regulation protein RsbQ